MARQAPCVMDPPSNDYRRPPRQLRAKCRTGTTTGDIRRRVNTYRCVSISSFPSRSEMTSFTAIGLLVMMYPILCKVKFETLHLAFRHRSLWIQIGFSIIINWLVAPFIMVSAYYGTLSTFSGNWPAFSSQLGLSWAFLPDKTGLREGLILVGLARCIAMVRMTRSRCRVRRLMLHTRFWSGRASQAATPNTARFSWPSTRSFRWFCTRHSPFCSYGSSATLPIP